MPWQTWPCSHVIRTPMRLTLPKFVGEVILIGSSVGLCGERLLATSASGCGFLRVRERARASSILAMSSASTLFIIFAKQFFFSMNFSIVSAKFQRRQTKLTFLAVCAKFQQNKNKQKMNKTCTGDKIVKIHF